MNTTVPSSRHRWLVLAICSLSLFIATSSAATVNVALTAIRTHLGASVSELQWTVDAYTLVLASLLLAAGSTADRFGRKRTFLVGLGVFTLGSLLCAVAPSVGWLIGFRAVQAVGGAMLNPVALAIITSVFTDAKERAQAIGVWGAVVGIGLGLGPLIGGVLTQTVGWQAIFWINVPVCLVAAVLTAVFVPESPGRRRRFDAPGQALVIVFLASLIGVLIEGPDLGWHSATTTILAATMLASLIAFVLIELRRDEPLIDLRFFRSVPFTSSIVIAVGVFAVQGSFLFLIALYLQIDRGLSALQAGLATLPLAIGQTLTAPISGHLVARRGPRLPLVVGAVAIVAASACLPAATAGPSWLLLCGTFLLLGIGLGQINPPITATAVEGMPRSQPGSASGIASAARQTGVALGVALAGSITGIGSAAALPAVIGPAAEAVWWTCAAIGLALVALALLSTSRRALASATALAHLIEEPDAGLRRTQPVSRDAEAVADSVA